MTLDCRILVGQLPEDTRATSNPIIQAEDLLRLTTGYLNRIATAVPDVHDTFVIFAEQMLAELRLRTVFRRMVSRADSAHSCSFLDAQNGPGLFSSHDAHEFHRLGRFPNAARRMELFEQSKSQTKVMFVLRQTMQQERPGQRGCAMSFSPGLTAETIRFHGV